MSLLRLSVCLIGLVKPETIIDGMNDSVTSGVSSSTYVSSCVWVPMKPCGLPGVLQTRRTEPSNVITVLSSEQSRINRFSVDAARLIRVSALGDMFRLLTRLGKVPSMSPAIALVSLLFLTKVVRLKVKMRTVNMDKNKQHAAFVVSSAIPVRSNSRKAWNVIVVMVFPLLIPRRALVTVPRGGLTGLLGTGGGSVVSADGTVALATSFLGLRIMPNDSVSFAHHVLTL